MISRIRAGSWPAFQNVCHCSRGLKIGSRERKSAATRVLIRLALDFWTWRRLALERLEDAKAARLMADAVACASYAAVRYQPRREKLAVGFRRSKRDPRAGCPPNQKRTE